MSSLDGLQVGDRAGDRPGWKHGVCKLESLKRNSGRGGLGEEVTEMTKDTICDSRRCGCETAAVTPQVMQRQPALLLCVWTCHPLSSALVLFS